MIQGMNILKLKCLTSGTNLLKSECSSLGTNLFGREENNYLSLTKKDNL